MPSTPNSAASATLDDWTTGSVSALDSLIHKARRASENRRTETLPAYDDFTGVSVGQWHAYGVRAGGQAMCWGGDGFSNEPQSVAASDCLASASGDGPCHRSYYCIRQTQPASGEFVSVAAADKFSCGARADGALKCWGRIPGVITIAR